MTLATTLKTIIFTRFMNLIFQSVVIKKERVRYSSVVISKLQARENNLNGQRHDVRFMNKRLI